jgi:nicotinate-nucleotide pyrophosphorylase (carboxylating)
MRFSGRAAALATPDDDDVLLPYEKCSRLLLSTASSSTQGGGVAAMPRHPTQNVRDVVAIALEEDVADVGDVSSLSTIPEDARATATLLAKADGILAGERVANEVLSMVDGDIEACWLKRDGDDIEKGEIFCYMRGSARGILRAERVVLNFMQRMSGIATLTKKMSERAKPARILETRKTAPGLRVIDKWAVLIGGGENHRMGLFDMVMIKDNHVAAARGIKNALESSTKFLIEGGEKYTGVMIELETRTMEEVKEVCGLLEDADTDTSRVQRVMLDNMSMEDMREAAGMLNRLGVETEASGNVTLDTIGGIGATGVTFISSGQLTHSVVALDISLNIENNE